MESQTIVEALLLGLLEGLTEFIPVSSTGHILLAGHFLGFESTGKAFEVLIQLGAILAVIGVFLRRLWTIFVKLPTSRRSKRFVLGVLIAFLPAAFLGALLHGFIKTVLFETPMLICIMLILGGVVLLVVDRMPLQQRYRDIKEFPFAVYLGIGLFQCLALIPGTSRSGSTIVGALLMGVEKRAAAEFSFFLAMPTMAGAFAYDLYKNHGLLSLDDGLSIALGFAVSFVAGAVVVGFLLALVRPPGFAPLSLGRVFVGGGRVGWWRFWVGGVGLGALLVLG